MRTLRNESPPEKLSVSDAVAVLLLLDDGRVVLQHRDDLPTIWYPDHWGLFGGAVEPGEKPLDALRREVFEELELEFTTEPTYLTRFDFDLGSVGLRSCYRIYYVARMTQAELDRVVLHEGKAVKPFSPDVASRDLKLVPYDAFALCLYTKKVELLGT